MTWHWYDWLLAYGFVLSAFMALIHGGKHLDPEDVPKRDR